MRRTSKAAWWAVCLVVAGTIAAAGYLCCRKSLSRAAESTVETLVAGEQFSLTGERATCLTPLSELITRDQARHRSRFSLVIDKSERLLKLLYSGKPVKSYLIALGYDPVSDKSKRGDNATPEGSYYVCEKNPKSSFYLSLKLSYPNVSDARDGLERGVIDRRTFGRIRRAIERGRTPPMATALGGDICLHGGGVGIISKDGPEPTATITDWTWGCMALRNEDIRELFTLLPVGAKVVIRP